MKQQTARQKSAKAASSSATVRREDIASMEDLRSHYLPEDAKERATNHMTPREIGEEFARKSLTAARQSLTR